MWLLANQLGETTFALGAGALGLVVGVGIAFGVLKARVDHALRWCEKNEDEGRRLDTRCNSIEVKVARMKGRTDRQFKVEDTQEWQQ